MMNVLNPGLVMSNGASEAPRALVRDMLRAVPGAVVMH
jgi:hypothetical protein